MWAHTGTKAAWPKIEALDPEHVLDEYDGPRLFTVRDRDGDLLLAYHCGEDSEVERFLLVPADSALVTEIQTNALPLRAALLGRGWAWIVDRKRNGTLDGPFRVNPRELPEDVLPVEGVCLASEPLPFLQLRLTGPGMAPGSVAASVVTAALEGATGAIRLLAGHVQRVSTISGRPPEAFRRLYDLPAVRFSFGSLTIAFASPLGVGQASLDDDEVLNGVGRLLRQGLDWASAMTGAPPNATPEWRAIVEALARLAPPSRGSVAEVEISGTLAAPNGGTRYLTRDAARRIVEARRVLVADQPSLTLEGCVREFDKDRLTFILRDPNGANLRTVSFSERQYDDVWIAFESDRRVVIVADKMPDGQMVDLAALTFADPDPPSPEPPDSAA